MKSIVNLENSPSVAIIVLNWNGKDNTCECIESVQKIDYPNYQIIVADNGSEDDSITVITHRFPDIFILENGLNLGYAEGNNRAITYAMEQGFDYILLLNNDAIVDPQVINSFISASQANPKAGVFGAKIYYLSEPRKIWFAGGKILSNFITFHEGGGEIDDGLSWEDIRPIDYACGCTLFFKSDVVKKIGALENNFFLLWEEVDFCYRARRAGFECLFVPKAIAWHKISASFKAGNAECLQSYFMVRNRLLWIERNISWKQRSSFYVKVFSHDLNYYIRSCISAKSDSNQRMQSQVSLVAVRDYVLRKFGDCPKWIRSI
jgi:GT2 family glycosyltransferase